VADKYDIYDEYGGKVGELRRDYEAEFEDKIARGVGGILGWLIMIALFGVFLLAWFLIKQLWTRPKIAFPLVLGVGVLAMVMGLTSGPQIPLYRTSIPSVPEAAPSISEGDLPPTAPETSQGVQAVPAESQVDQNSLEESAQSTAAIPESTSGQNPDEVVRAYDQAFNARSLESLLQLFADDAVVMSSDGSVMQGKDQLRVGFGETLGFENLWLESNDYQVAGDIVTRFIRISWGPAQSPTVRELNQEMTIQEGKITALTNTALTQEPITGQDPGEVLEAYDRALNAHDLDGLLQLFANDAVAISSDGSVMRGKEELRAGYGETLSLLENLKLESDDYQVEGDTVIRIFRISWGPAEAPTIRTISQEVVIQGGKIISLKNTAIN
jgi:ketosteroid isomerase-like protein